MDKNKVFKNEPPKNNLGKIIAISAIAVAGIVGLGLGIYFAIKGNTPQPKPVGEKIKVQVEGVRCHNTNGEYEWTEEVVKGDPLTISAWADTDFIFEDEPGTVISNPSKDHEPLHIESDKSYMTVPFLNVTEEFKVTITATPKEEFTLKIANVDPHWEVWGKNEQGEITTLTEKKYKADEEVRLLICSKEEGLWSEPEEADLEWSAIPEEKDFEEGYITFIAPGKDLVLTTTGKSKRIGYKVTVLEQRCSCAFDRIVSIGGGTMISVRANNKCRTPNPTVPNEVKSNVVVDGVDFDYENDYVRAPDENKEAKIYLRNINADVSVSVTCLLIGPF